MITKFNEKSTYKDIENTRVLNLYNRLENGEKPTSEENKKDIEILFNELGHGEAYENGIYLLMGYKFNFRKFMKKYLVKMKYYGWVEIYSFNKTFIRENSMHPSYILQIIELED